MSKFNHRLSYKKRRAKETERKPPVRRRDDFLREESVKAAKGWFASLFLLPVAAISLFTMVELFFRANQRAHFWRTAEFVCFLLGATVWSAAFFWARWRPVRSYVFAHEFTHLVIAKLFGGKIYDWQVSAEGGYVETNKSNTWITLGPYLVPFYTLLVLMGFGVVGLFTDVSQWQHVQVAGFTVPYRWAWLLYWLVGFTWSHHLTFTVQTVHVEQGDLTRNGEFFSLMLIFLVNLTLIGVLFFTALPGASFMEVADIWIDVAKGAWTFVSGVLGEIVR